MIVGVEQRMGASRGLSCRAIVSRSVLVVVTVRRQQTMSRSRVQARTYGSITQSHTEQTYRKEQLRYDESDARFLSACVYTSGISLFRHHNNAVTSCFFLLWHLLLRVA